MSYPDINKLYNYREFKEIFTNENLLEEKLHMKRYQILPSRYMSSDNEAVKRFLIYHPPGSGKSYTALWILLNFINFYEKPAIILVKNKESIINFKSRIESWYSFTFNFYKPPEGITNYQQFIKKYIEFYTYFSFFKSIKNIEDIKMHENRFIIIDEIHNFRNTKENKFIYKRINKFLSSIKNARVIFMSATPIFDNYNEISSLIKLIVPTINNNTDFTPKKVEEIMKGHVSYYGLNPPDTIVNYNGKCIQGINKYKIFEIPMKGFQLQYYQNLTKNVKNLNSMEMGINLTKAAIGVIDFNNFKLNIPHDTNNEKKRYIFKNGHIIYNDIEIQKTIIKHSENLSDYCCKFYHCLDIINKANSSDGLVFIYCNLIEDIGIYYFAALLCSMGYNYVYDNKSAKRFSKKKFLDKEFDYPELKEIRRGNKKNKKWNFTFITGDKRLCPNVLERLDMFNNSNNKDGSAIKVLIGSDILSESVDILNVRQLHILTPHWNYEKINQIIGRVRRVGSHMALPPEQRNVNIYLYSAYDPTKQYSDSINYSIDYFKYIKCENKYNQSLQYYKALQNASIESLVIKNLSKDHNLKSSQYSHLYIEKKLPIYLSLMCNYLKTALDSSDYVNINDIIKEVPVLNISIIKEIIKIIKTNNIIINNRILDYSCGLMYLKMTSNLRIHNDTKNPTNINPLIYLLDHSTNSSKSLTSGFNNSGVLNNENKKDIEIENKTNTLEHLLENNLNKEFYNIILNYSHTEILEVIKHSLKYNIKNIKYFFSPYWLKYDDLFYISYISTIKSNSYSNNKNKSITDFNNIIYYSDKSFKEWSILKDSELNKISKIVQKHYKEEKSKRINNNKKFAFMLCNDFIIRYVDSCKNVCSNETSNTKDLRNSNRGRSVYNFGNKKELIEKLICSMCFDDNEKKLHQIEGYRIITPENILELNKNNNEDTTNLMNHIIKIITNNNLEEYCCKRPHQAFLMYKLFCLLPNLLKMTKDNIIEEWKKYLFKYNLIVIL